MAFSGGGRHWFTRVAWVATMAMLAGVLLIPLAAHGQPSHGQPSHGPPISPPAGPPLSPPVGPPLSPPVGPPDGFYDFTSQFSDGFLGCNEWIRIDGTEYWRGASRIGPSGNELYKFTVTRDAYGVGTYWGAGYDVISKDRLVGVGWPPLAPPTSNIVSYREVLVLESDQFGRERHTIMTHRVLHWDDETQTVKVTGEFRKVSSQCK